MPERDALLAILQGDLALAGLMLVFAGFVISKAETYQTRGGDRYKYAGLASIIPISTAILSAWASVDAVGGNYWFAASLSFFKLVLVLTMAYILVAGWMLRP
jgi:uncharacterized membrane protein